MAIYSEKHNYLFLASPQTGSKAIAKTLLEQLDGLQVPERDIRQRGEVLVQKHHCTARTLVNNKLLPEVVVRNAFKFCGVRNPFDQLVSRYLKMRGRFAEGGANSRHIQRNPKKREVVALANELDFPQWVQASHQQLLEANIPVKGCMAFVEDADFVIRFESLEDDFQEALRRIGITQPVALPLYNVTEERKQGEEKRDYRTFYDAKTISLVYRLYAPVIERFGYRFDEPTSTPSPSTTPVIVKPPSPMRTCILHIGMPKTGTMSVQASLGQAKALAPGFKYIAFDKETNCSDALMEIFAKEVPLRERGQRVDWGPDKVAAARQKQLDLLQCGFDRSDCHTFILSGERLHNLSVPHLTALRDELLRHVDEVRVLAYVRDAASWIESAFQQRLKTGDGADFNNLRRVMPEFRLKLERFDQVFGRDKVVLRKFEPATFAGNDVVLDFCHWIGLPFDAAQVIRDNEGISRDRAALIYIYRHFIKKPQMTLADKADVRLLMRQTRSLAGPKLRMAPAVIAPYLQQIEVDMAWMEGRLGASVSTPPREQEGMLTCEADLLSPTPTMVEWLAQPPNDPTWLTPGEQPTGEAVAKAAARLIKNLRDKQAKTAKPAAKTAKAPGKPGKPVKPAAVAPVSPAEG